jgi:hypothetical protein
MVSSREIRERNANLMRVRANSIHEFDEFRKAAGFMSEEDRLYNLRYVMEHLDKRRNDIEIDWKHPAPMFYEQANWPIAIIAQTLGHETEKIGRSIYDYVQFRTGLTLNELSELNECRTTEELVDKLYDLVLKKEQYLQ